MNNLSLVIFILIRILFTILYIRLANFLIGNYNGVFWILFFFFQILTLLFLSFSFCKCKEPECCKIRSIFSSNNPIFYILNILFFISPIIIAIFLYYCFFRTICCIISLKNYRLYIIFWTIIFDFFGGTYILIKNENSILLGLLEIASGICSLIFMIIICGKPINEHQIINVDEAVPENVNELAHMNLNANEESQIINIGEAPVPEINNNFEENIINNEKPIQQNRINNEEPIEQNINNDEEIEHFEGR